jgi:hypothetical protein
MSSFAVLTSSVQHHHCSGLEWLADLLVHHADLDRSMMLQRGSSEKLEILGATHRLKSNLGMLTNHGYFRYDEEVIAKSSFQRQSKLFLLHVPKVYKSEYWCFFFF